MSLKIEFIEKASQPGANMSELCREHGISRQTGHKLLKRFREGGYEGLEERSRRPRNSPLATSEELVMSVLRAREAHPHWGPKKLVVLLQRQHGKQTPSRASIARILKRFGCVRARKRRPALSIIDRVPSFRAERPNDLWTIDFKGWWRAGDGAKCEPLTVRDAFSRFVFTCKLLRSNCAEDVRAELERIFRRNGIPRAIQCDNGPPFIHVQARAGLTTLSSWWVALGIELIRSRPACPQDNGAHERMHRDIRADIQAVPELDRISEQRALDRWRQEFNRVRPHEALGGKTPAELYVPSERRGLREPRFLYPATWLRRSVSEAGKITLNDQKITVGRALRGRHVALEPTGSLRYRVWFTNIDLGEIAADPSADDIDLACQRFIEERTLRKEKVA